MRKIERHLSLSFVEENGDTTNYWNVKASGNWAEDLATGKRYLQEMANYVAREDDPMVLRRIIAEVSRVSPQTGIEVGFVDGLALCAAQIARQSL